MSASPCILVLDDRPTDRLYLTTLLGYRGYSLIEAANGEEGLAAAAAQRPDLVISDVLMPRMDGYEFVRRLRRMPGYETVPVIFYTATYHEAEARRLAEECGVVEIMLKPSEPDVILAKVDQALTRGQAVTPSLSDEAFDRLHVQVTTDTLLEKIRHLEASERRMTALVEIGKQLIAERDPGALLTHMCESVRSATGSEKGFIAMLGGSDTEFSLIVSSGFEDRDAERLSQLKAVPLSMRPIVQERKTFRGRTSNGHTQTLPWALPVSTYLLAPIVSRDAVLGVIGLSDRIGGAEYSDLDEQAATTIGVQAGIAYENALLINQLQSRATELKERENVTEFALAAARIGVYERTFADNRIRVSAGVRGLLGLAEDHPVHDLAAAIPEQDRQAILDVINPAIARRGDFSFDLALDRDSAKPRHLQARGRLQIDASGQPERLLSVLIDMTERRGLEDQLRQSQKMEAIGKLAGGVAHDFNNLLTVIQGYARFLTESARDDEQRRDAQAIADAGERAVRLTRQLLAFSRRQPRDIAVFDLDLLIQNTAGLLGRLIGEHIKLVTELGKAGTIENDRGQVEQVVVNLVVNARDAMPSGGVLTIDTARCRLDDVEWVRLRVMDTGSGMNEETKARIFEPFFTTKDVGKGTGLGLATVFGIVAQSGGRIDVDSAPGRGTTFTILLPPAASEIVTAAQTAVARRGTESVLVVEDNDAVRELLATLLERTGYRVTQVSDAGSALATDLETIDVMLTDVLMPGGLGPDLVAAARSRKPTLPVVYVSGYAPDDTLGEIPVNEPTVFLAKPFTVETLTQKIREVLDR